MNIKTLHFVVKYCSIALILLSLTSCSQTDCGDCNSETASKLDPAKDMAAYLSLNKHALYVLPQHEKMALDALNAQPIDINLFQTTITPASGESFKFNFTMITSQHPSLFADMDQTIIANINDAFHAIKDQVNEAVKAAKDQADEAVEEAAAAADAAIAAATAAANAAVDAAGGNEENDKPLSWVRDNILFNEVKGVIVWKNARCGTPRPKTVSQCQGPIPAEGEDLAGMFWRTTTYSKAKCERGTSVCTELRQVGSFVEIAEDNQCSIVKIIRPIDTLYYCQ